MGDITRRAALATGFALCAPASQAAQPDPALASLAARLDADIADLALSPLAAMTRVHASLAEAADQGLFDPWRGGRPVELSKHTLVGAGGLWRKWKLQLFHIPENRSHPPHCHENLASCIMVIDGRLRAREYQRFRAQDSDEAVLLQLAADGELNRGEALLTTETHHNAHWFGAVGGPALALNFKASGHFRRELPRLANRRYVDPSSARQGPFRAPFITGDEARRRFGGMAL